MIDLFHRSFEGKWLCSLGSGGGGGGGSSSTVQNQTTTSKSEPWGPLQPYLMNLAELSAANLTASGNTTANKYTGQGYAGPTAPQLGANTERLNSLIPFLRAMQGNVQPSITHAQDTIAGKYLDPATNPTLVPGLQATINPLLANTRNIVLPQATGEAWNAGAYGSLRHGAREAQITKDMNDTIADTISRAVMGNYQYERTAQNSAAAALPGLLQTQGTFAALPSDVMSAVGGEQQGWNQGALTDASRIFENQQYNQYTAPALALQQYAQLLQGIAPGAGQQSGTSTGTSTPPQQSKMSGLIGGASGGAQLGSMFGPWGTAIGGGLGALLGFL